MKTNRLRSLGKLQVHVIRHINKMLYFDCNMVGEVPGWNSLTATRRMVSDICSRAPPTWCPFELCSHRICTSRWSWPDPRRFPHTPHGTSLSINRSQYKTYRTEHLIQYSGYLESTYFSSCSTSITSFILRYIMQ